MIRPERPLLVYDGDCAFCARGSPAGDGDGRAGRVRTVAGRSGPLPGVPPERFRESVVLIEPDGRVTRAPGLCSRSLAEAAGRRALERPLRAAAGVGARERGRVRLIAGHRDMALRVTRLLWGEHVAPPGERAPAWLFLRLLAVAYATAFASLAVQIVGLAGRDGILPITDLLGWRPRTSGRCATGRCPRSRGGPPAMPRSRSSAGPAAAWHCCCYLGIAPAINARASVGALPVRLEPPDRTFLGSSGTGLLIDAGFLAIFPGALALAVEARDGYRRRLAARSGCCAGSCSA